MPDEKKDTTQEKTEDLPSISIDTGATEPPQKKRKPRSDKGKPRGRRATEPTDTIALKYTLMAISVAYATRSGDDRYVMSESEALAIEEGFNKWQSLRIPQLQEYLPETYLVLPILAYVMRVQMAEPVAKPITITEKDVETVVSKAKAKTSEKKEISSIEELRDIAITPDLNESRTASKGKFKPDKPKPKKDKKK